MKDALPYILIGTISFPFVLYLLWSIYAQVFKTCPFGLHWYRHIRNNGNDFKCCDICQYIKDDL